MKTLIAITTVIWATLMVAPTYGGQGAQRMLYTVPNNNFIENPSGDTIVTINDTSGSIATLQTLINNARTSNPNSIIVIRLMNGATYSVSNAGLVLGSGECLVGTGATVMAASPSVTNNLLSISAGASNVSVAGGTFNGNGANIFAIYAGGNNRVNIDEVTALNCGQDCIQLNGNGGSTFDNELTVTRCDVSGSSGHSGISIWNATQTACIDNNCHNNAVGIWMGNNGYCTIANNTCESNSTGIDFSSGNDNYIANNTCANNGTGILLAGSSTMVVSDLLFSNTVSGINSAGNGNIFCDCLFGSANATNSLNSGSGDDIVAYKGALNGSGQNYFYPPLIDDQHTNTIVNGMGRFDLYDSSTGPIDNVQSAYDAAVGANPNSVIVLHLNGSYTVGGNPLTIGSYTCVLLGGWIQINSSTSASCAVTASSGAQYISFSGGTIDGGSSSPPSNGRNGFYFSGVGMFQIDSVTLQNFGNNSRRVGGSDVMRIDHGSTPRVITRCTINGGSARGIWLATSGVRDIVSDNTVMDVQMDGVDCDESTFASLVKFNYLYNNGRYGVFIEQSASDNCILGNICNYNKSFDIGCYNNSSSPRGATAYNSILCNSLLGNNGLRNGSTGDGSSVTSSDNFFFNNTVMNANIQSENYGSQNYYSQNFMGNSSISTSGTEVFFNSPDVSGNIQIKDSHSGLAVLVTNAATTNGAPVITGLPAVLGNYEWQLIPTDSGYYRVMNENSGLALVVLGAATNSGAAIIQWTYNASQNDEWMPIHGAIGLYGFSNRLSGLYLDVAGASLVPGTQLDQQPFTGAANEQFILADIPSPALVTTNSTALWTSGGAPDGNWETAANWGGVGLTAGDWLSFGAGPVVSTTNNFPAGLIVDNIAFASTAPSFTLNGNGITLAAPLPDAGGNPTGGSVTNGSVNAQTINLPVTLATGSHTLATAAGAGSLTLSAGLTNNLGATAVFGASGSAINATLANNSSGAVGGWALYTSSSSSLINNNQNGGANVNWAAMNAGAVSALGSYTVLSGNSAKIVSSTGSNVKITSGGTSGNDDTMNSSGTTTINTLYYDGGSFAGTSYLDIPSGDTLRFGAQGGIIANLNHYVRIGNDAGGTVTAGGAVNTPGQLYLYNVSAYNSAQLEFWCPITDNGSSAYPVSVIIYGSCEFDLPNTYSGGTYVNAGEFWQNGSGDIFGYGPVYIFPGARVDMSGQTETITNDFFIAGNGFPAGNAPGAIKNTYNGTLSGTITLMADATIDPNGYLWPNTSYFTGLLTGTGSLTIGGSSPSLSAGFATFSGTNDYTGDLIIDASASVNSGSGVYIATGRNNILDNGGTVNLIGGATKPAVLDLNGTSQTINGLASPSGTMANAWVTNSSAGASTLALGNNGISAVFGGVIANGTNSGAVISLVKNGPGTQTLTGSNTYTGTTTINAGVLALGGAGSMSKSASIILASNAMLDASGRPDQTVTLVSPQVLQGTGAISVNLTVEAGAAIEPGNASVLGTLTIAGSAQLQGTTVMKLNAATGACDQINASSVTYGGTLTVTNLSGAFAAGQSFQLFSSGAYSGTFTSTNLPTLNTGLAWINNLASTGQLTVASTQNPISFLSITNLNVSGSNFVFSGSNTGAGTFYLLAATNLLLPPSQWQVIATDTVSASGNFSISISNLTPANTLQHYFLLGTGQP